MTETVHFKVSGDFITKHARDRMFERGWTDAVHFLEISIIGLSLDQVRDILTGKNKLVGTNNFTLKKEKAAKRAELLDRLDYAYSGIVFDGKHHFRPYAYVDNWGMDDLITPDPLNPYCPPVKFSGECKSTIGRNVYYMTNRQTDRPVVLEHKGDTVVVLWERVDAPPFWVTHYNGQHWQEALDAWLATKHWLESRGHKQSRSDPPTKSEERVDVTAEANGLLDAIAVTASKTKSILEESDDVDPIDTAKLMAGIAIAAKIKSTREESEDVPKPPAPDPELASRCGWVTLDGKFYPCRYSEHKYLAESLLFHSRGVVSPNYERDAEVLGWVKIGYSFGKKEDEYFIFHYVDDMRLTADQLLTIQLWCKKHNQQIPQYLGYKMPDDPANQETSE